MSENAYYGLGLRVSSKMEMVDSCLRLRAFLVICSCWRNVLFIYLSIYLSINCASAAHHMDSIMFSTRPTSVPPCVSACKVEPGRRHFWPACSRLLVWLLFKKFSELFILVFQSTSKFFAWYSFSHNRQKICQTKTYLNVWSHIYILFALCRSS